VKCGGNADVVVQGDAALYNSLVAHQADIAAAFNMTIALKDPILNVLASAGSAIQAAGSLSAAGGVCIASSLGVSGKAQASFSVSLNCQASVQGKGSASSS
jgi:hypothetical protein